MSRLPVDHNTSVKMVHNYRTVQKEINAVLWEGTQHKTSVRLRAVFCPVQVHSKALRDVIAMVEAAGNAGRVT